MEYHVAPAEASGLASNSVDLITVAQALHWFDNERFFTEAIRVLKPGGVLSYWCYEHCFVEPECDDFIRKIFAEVDSYWPPERRIVEGRYQSVTPPFPDITAERFSMQAIWTVDDILNYMRTWSASQRFMDDKGVDPTSIHASELQAAWGSDRRAVNWPITLYAGRK